MRQTGRERKRVSEGADRGTEREQERERGQTDRKGA